MIRGKRWYRVDMAKVQSPSSATRKLFSLTVLAEARMQVEASDAGEAGEIIRAILGGGKWTKTDLIGLPFAIKLAPKSKRATKNA
jgi:hypothetical protein